MQTVNVALGDRSYDILVGRGLLQKTGKLVAKLFSPRRVLIVSDSRVADLYMKPVQSSLSEAGFTVSAAVVPEGEGSKSGEQLFELYEACFAAGLERRSLVVALGGGVVGDLAGYLAASYLRGLAFIQVPTTLLSQVDSSVGGKTGINLLFAEGGKNLVGAFHQPSLVLGDVETLRTLDERQIATGLAEVVKHAMISDVALLARLEAEADKLSECDLNVLEEVVAWNCRIKARVVVSDELESGQRAILNYGHTIGHAVESVASYGVYTHGEAVAVGMNGEALIASRRGLISDAIHRRQQGLLEKFGLPGKLREPLAVDRLLDAMRHDKKVVAGRLRLVLPEAIGRVRIVDDVTDDELHEALCHLQP